MKKDGGKIKNTRIKLFLSSRTEMQHVIDRITKHSSPVKEKESSNDWPYLDHLSRRDRSPFRKGRRHSRSRSPSRYHEHHSESRKNVRYRNTPSPYKKSPSPQFQKENSPFEKLGMPPPLKSDINNQAEYIQNNSKLEMHSKIPLDKSDISSHSHSGIQMPFFQSRNENPNHHKEFFLHYENLISNLLKQDFKSEAIEEKFESHIKEELLALQKPKSAIPFIDDWKALSDNQNLQNALPQHDNELVISHKNHISTYNDKYEQPFSTYTSMPPFESPSLNMQTFADKTVIKETLPQNNYVIRIAGIDPSCSYRDIQLMLKGIFAPQINMQWECDKNGYKTDVVYVKLTNKDDFIKILNDAKHNILGKSIDISPCPDFIANRYFPLNSHSGFDISPEKINESCYMLKGLPFEVTYEDLIQFFHGLKIADLFIIYNTNGIATGTGFVAFNDPQDFQLAMEMNGKKIGHRYIELILTHRNELVEARNKYGNHNAHVEHFGLNKEQKSFSDQRPSSPPHKRPLCALITGLPPNVQIKHISDFFNEFGLKPYAIHIMLNNKHNPIGRAYVEFIDLLDFDLALKCHGKSFKGNIICIKQILYDEMITILNNQLAQHSFGNLNTAFHEESNLPEKVPYLWEPPDEQDEFIEDQKQSQNKEEKFTKRNIHDYHHLSNIDNQKLLDPNLQGRCSDKDCQNPKQIIRSQNESTDKLFRLNSDMDKYFSRESESVSFKSNESPTRSLNLKDSKSFQEINFQQKETDLTVEENEMNNKNRIPVKFEVKPSILKKTKTDEIFEKSSSEEDDAKKLSRLSPEKSSGKKFSHLSPEKSLPTKNKSSSKEEKNVHTNKKDINSKSTNDIEKPKLEIKKGDGASRFKDKITTKGKIKKFDKKRSYNFQRKTNPYQYSSSRSKSNQKFGNSNKNYSLKRNNMNNVRNTRPSYNDQGCVVQVSNVHPSIGAKELTDFFRGFDFIEDKFIRKFNARREPTRDIRVTFRNPYQAKKAVKNLNGCRLRGDRIEMFIVN